MARFIACLAFVLALSPSGSEGYQEHNPYLPNLQKPPAIYGTVVELTDHSMGVNTDSGERIDFAVDSRSVMPTPAMFGEGTRVRVDFHLMESGRYLAKRVTPVAAGEGMTTGPTARSGYREMEYGREVSTAEYSNQERARYADQHENRLVQYQEPDPAGRTAEENAPTGAEPTAAAAEDTDRDLPATASSRAVFEGIGALALALGMGLWLVRRRRAA